MEVKGSGMVSDTQLYGSVIAITSGIYSLWSASTTPQLMTGNLVMLIVGIVVLIHGGVLLTRYADRLENASGPLMMGYAVIMLLNQLLLGTGVLRTSGMGMQSGMGPSQMTVGMGWDAGMVFLAVLMLASGLIMTRNQSMHSTMNRP